MQLIHSATRRHLPVSTIVILVVTLVALGFVSSASADKNVKVKPHKGQVGNTFVNNESVAAYGIHIELTTKAEVMTDATTNDAGPFTTIRGNGTNKIELIRPPEPIQPGGDGVTLVFRSFKKDVDITKWWWLDVSGKKIGKPQKF